MLQHSCRLDLVRILLVMMRYFPLDIQMVARHDV